MKVRFIAGIVCPKCGAQDSVRIYIPEDGEVDEQLRDCVTCGHEVTTRVNHTKPTAVQEVEPQILKLR